MVTATKKKVNNRSKVKLFSSLTTGLVCSLFLLVLFVTDPIVFTLRWYTRVTNGSIVHELLYKEFEGGHLSVTLFNITNAEQFMAGEDEKLKVQEVGPFTYVEIRRLENVELDFENGRMKCSPKLSKWFQPDESIGRPEDITVTMPNLPMLGLSSQLSSYPYWTRVGLDLLIRQMKSQPIVTMDVHSYLWGYEDSLLSLAHTVAPGSIHFNKMGILDRIYDPDMETILEASIKDEDKFMIKKRNGKTKLQMSPLVDPEYCELCDTFENSYEGVSYPTGLTPDFPIRLYRIGLCKILDLEYHGQKKMPYGADAMVYHFSDRFFSLNRSEQNDGVLDMSDCFYGTPLAATKPHFLDMDPSMYARIEGIKPDEKYRGWVSIEPKSGMQIETDFSLQMNLLIKDVSHNAQTRHFSNMILPICYLKIVQPPLPDESKDILNKMYVVGPYLLGSIKIFLFLIAFVSWFYFFQTIYRNRLISKDILKGIEKSMTFHKTEMVKPDRSGNVEVPLMTSQICNNNDSQS